METTVNKECDNYMKQMFNIWENGYRIFYIIFPEICRSYKIVPKALYVKKNNCIGNPSTEFLTSGGRKSLISNCNYAIR